MTTKIAGLDIGYGYTKLDTGKTTVAFPSIIGNAVELRYRGNLITNGAGRPTTADIRLRTPEGIRFVGQLAAEQSDVTWSPQNRKRTEDDDIITLMLAAFSEAGLSGKVNLVTGLPVRWYNDKKVLIDRLRGTHTLHREGGKRETIFIDEVIVLPQPFGTIYDQILTNTARVNKSRQKLLNLKIGAIDIGMHTTDYVWCDRMNYIESRSSSVETGMSTVYKLVSRSVEDRLGLALSMHQAEEAVQVGYVKVAGERRKLAPVIEPTLKMVSQEILSALSDPWGDGKELDIIFGSGGGASYVGPYISRRYAQTTIVEDSQSANARGYRKYGLLKWGS
jgi:plasmid segregation protein ParM